MSGLTILDTIRLEWAYNHPTRNITCQNCGHTRRERGIRMFGPGGPVSWTEKPCTKCVDTGVTIQVARYLFECRKCQQMRWFSHSRVLQGTVSPAPLFEAVVPVARKAGWQIRKTRNGGYRFVCDTCRDTAKQRS